MEVLLKKTKITKSVVNQSLLGSSSLYLDHSNYDVLGWCLLSGKRDVRYILLYNRIKNTIVRLQYTDVSEITTESKNVQRGSSQEGYTYPMTYYLHIYCRDFGRSLTVVYSENEQEVLLEKEKLIAFLREVNQKGQIYV